MKHRFLVSVLVATVVAASLCGAQSVEQGVALYNSRNYAEAKAALLRFGEKDPVAAFHLGQISMGENEDGKAAEWFEPLMNAYPDSTSLYVSLAALYANQKKLTKHSTCSTNASARNRTNR